MLSHRQTLLSSLEIPQVSCVATTVLMLRLLVLLVFHSVVHVMDAVFTLGGCYLAVHRRLMSMSMFSRVLLPLLCCHCCSEAWGLLIKAVRAGY